MADAEGDLFSGCALHILKVYKDALGCLRAEIHGILRIFRHALERLEHQVELTDLCKIVLSAGGTRYFVLFDKRLHLLMAPAVNALADINAMFMGKILDHLVCAEALMALLAVHQRIAEAAEMAGCNPRLGIHQDRAVDPDIVRVLLYEFLPPGPFYIVLELHAKVAIVPCICKTAVDFRSRIHKPSGFRKSHDFVHCLFHHFSLSFHIPDNAIL